VSESYGRIVAGLLFLAFEGFIGRVRQLALALEHPYFAGKTTAQPGAQLLEPPLLAALAEKHEGELAATVGNHDLDDRAGP